MDNFKEQSLIAKFLSEKTNKETTSFDIKRFVDEIPGGFLIYTADKSEKILYANTALIKIFGCENDEEFLSLTGGTFGGMVHPEDLAGTERSISEQIKINRDNLDYVEYRIIRKDGAVRWVEDYGHFMHTADGDFFYVFITDATKRIEEEFLQERKQKQMLEEALKAAKAADVAKSAFLSSMSHDMRTPLNALFGYTALAKKNASDEKAVCEYLDKIERAGKNILELVVKVLEFSYGESHESDLIKQECSVKKSVGEVYDELLERARQKNIEVSLDARAIKHDAVYADTEKLKRALLYISNNAVKYTKSGGKVEITAEETACDSDKATYKFTVKDNGIGISEEELKYIFEPFERVNNTTFSGEYGMGLGLTIAGRIIDLMGGTIDVKSETGKGSAFTVTLTLKIQPTAENDGESNKIDFTGKKILIVEDNEINMEIESEILEDLGFTVDTAENGKIAVDKVAASLPGEYSLVLMDIQMPVMDGNEAARQIRKMPEHITLPIVALSANAFESDRLASLEAGMDDHLPKPIDIEKFIKSVTAVFGKYEKRL